VEAYLVDPRFGGFDPVSFGILPDIFLAVMVTGIYTRRTPYKPYQCVHWSTLGILICQEPIAEVLSDSDV
jgi:hypothetical protein